MQKEMNVELANLTFPANESTPFQIRLRILEMAERVVTDRVREVRKSLAITPENVSDQRITSEAIIQEARRLNSFISDRAVYEWKPSRPGEMTPEDTKDDFDVAGGRKP